ncbi:MAG: lysylphosphatidylglycerol synthase transmembrane domain-containing protein [Acidimicrobiales bacterium]
MRRVLEAAMVGAGAYALYDQRQEVGQAARLFAHLRWEWVLLACAAELASMVIFARLQRWLLRVGGVDLDLWPMVEITLAGNALAVSLPGGAAWSAGFAFEQLRRRGASRALSVWVVLVAGALSSFALFVVLVVGVELAGGRGPARDFRVAGAVLAAIPIAAGMLGLAAWRSAAVRSALGSAGSWGARHLPKGETIGRLLRSAWEHVTIVRPTVFDWAASGGMAVTNWLYDGGCLVASMYAVGASVPWPGVLVAYGVAQVGASLPITPGGLGIVEGSLSYALILYGVPVKDAVASVLLYRIISFWSLVPVGWGAWGVLELAGRRGRSSARPHPWAWHHS